MTIRPFGCVIIRMDIAVVGSIRRNVPLVTGVNSDFLRFTLERRVSPFFCVVGRVFCFSRCIQHVLFPVSGVLFCHPSIGPSLVLVFVLVGYICRLRSSFYVQIVLATVCGFPFCVLRTQGTYSVKVDVTFRFPME